MVFIFKCLSEQPSAHVPMMFPCCLLLRFIYLRLGTWVGLYVDRYGRRMGCILFCVLEVIINTLEHFPSLYLLLLGRVLGGISTSLLFSAFESWMVTEHRARGFPEDWLASTHGLASTGNGIAAVLPSCFVLFFVTIAFLSFRVFFCPRILSSLKKDMLFSQRITPSTHGNFSDIILAGLIVNAKTIVLPQFESACLCLRSIIPSKQSIDLWGDSFHHFHSNFPFRVALVVQCHQPSLLTN